ncbi:uncharacterized protein [Maniola hyperantus]
MTKESKLSWTCHSCRSKQPKTDNSNTPIRATSNAQTAASTDSEIIITDSNVTRRKRLDPTAYNTNVSDNSSSDVQSLLAEVKLLTKEISSLKNMLEDATTSLNRCHERLDAMGAAISSNESRISALERRNAEIDSLKGKVIELQTEVDMQAQDCLKNEVEICGASECPGENTTHIMMLLAKKIGVDLSEQEIDWSTRVGPRILTATSATGNARKQPRPIVVRLLRRAKRDEIIKAIKVRRNVTSTDLNLSGPAEKIFVNERLTSKNRLLFRESRMQAKQMGFAFCWCKGGTIYVRQREGKPAVAIRNNEDLNRLVSKYGTPTETTSQ